MSATLDNLLAGLCAAANAGDERAWFRHAAELLRQHLGCQVNAVLTGANTSLLSLVDGRIHVESGAEEPPEQAVRLAEGKPRNDIDRRLVQAGLPCRAQLPLRCGERWLGSLYLGRSDSFAGLEELLAGAAGVLALGLEHVRARAEIGALRARLSSEAGYLRDQLRRERDLRVLTGDSPPMKSVRQAIQQVAGADSTVLITGETGTGKELVARAIHQLSPRRERLLVAVNCAALAPALIASELFGHEQGAFTGAVKRRLGRFELAQAGSLFLDEIGELSAENQVLLLRVLQERALERVGGSTPIPVDVRVLAATHRDLEAEVRAGRFRSDLFYRLNVFPIRLPALRERAADIPALVEHFVGHFSRRLQRPTPKVTPAGLDLLRGYRWPGNVRELENVIERALIVSTGDTLEIDPSWFATAEQAAADASLAATERQAIVAALERAGGKIYGPRGAAKALRLKPSTLYGKMRKLNIPRAGS